MPIVASDIVYRLSGGTGNTDPNASIGGARSTAGGGVITTDTINNVWDNVAGADSAAGDIEYRCIYILNNHGSLTLTAPVIWIDSNTASADTTVAIAIGSSAVNGTETAVANENTAPSGPTFSTPTSFGAGLALGDLAAGAHKAVWIRRTVTAGAAAANNDAYVLKVQGETAA